MSYNVLIERLTYLNDLLVGGNLDEKLLSSISNEVKEITEELKTLISYHAQATGSPKAKRVLENFEEYLPQFTKVIPYDFKRILEAKKAEKQKENEKIVA